MNGNFYSNDMLVKIRTEERMAEAEAYRRAVQVEQASTPRQSRRIRFHSFGWIRRLVVRASEAGA
jgi:hypothetical protein